MRGNWRSVIGIGASSLLMGEGRERVTEGQHKTSFPSPSSSPTGGEGKRAGRYKTSSLLMGEGRERVKMASDIARLARNLRRRSTRAEHLLWRHLQKKMMESCKFRRQEPIGNFIVDFVCFERNLVVEVDGGQHNLMAEIKRDIRRGRWLASQGFRVLRFWNNEVLANTYGVLEVIREHCLDCPSPQSSPTRGEETKSSAGQALLPSREKEKKAEINEN